MSTGILSLQINDNSAKAAEGLGRLATSLKRVQKALGNGLKLGNTASQIERLTKALNNAIPEESISRLERLAKAIETLNGAGRIDTHGLKSAIGAVSGSVDQLKGSIEENLGGAMRQVQQEVQEVNDGMERATRQAESFYQIVRNTAWQAGNMADKFGQIFTMWNANRMRNTLGSGFTGTGLSTDFETRMTQSWRNNAIDVEGTVTDAIEDALEGHNPLRLSATSSETFDEAIKRSLMHAGGAEIPKAEEIVKGLMLNGERPQFGIPDEAQKGIEKTKVLLLTAGEAAEEATEKLAGFKRVWNGTEWQSAGYNSEQWQNRARAADLYRNMMSRFDSQQSEASAPGAMDRFNERLSNMRNSLHAFIGERVQPFINNFSEGLRNLVRPMSDFAGQLMRVARYRFLRSILKHISEGFSEGVKNVYQYSKAINSDFAPAMDGAASSLLQMKNSIGAAVAPAIQMLIPLLQRVVSAFIHVINYVNQFFALLNGQATWTQAVPATTSAFEDQTQAANGAAAAVKDLLADWDELNIIQSESSGGAGGGASGAAVDYLNMFQEVAQFDNRIKDLVERLRMAFGSLKNLVLEIGAALLGWQLASNFTGFIHDLGLLIAGGAMIVIGLQLGYGAGFSAGVNGSFTQEDIVQAIAGAVVGGIGGWIIGHSAAGVALGVTISLTATLLGYLEGGREAADVLKWGDTSLTPEEVNEYVQGLFNFDVTARIDVFDTVIESQNEARRKLNAAVIEFNRSLSKVHIGVDGTPRSIQEAADRCRDVIQQINANLKTSEQNLEILTKITPIQGSGDGEGLLSEVKIADQTMSAYFTGIGEEIAKWIDQGQQTGWKNNEAQMALSLMEHQQNILDQAEQNRATRDFQVSSELNISGMDRDTAQKVLEREEELIDEYKEKYRTALENQARDLFYYADIADAAGLTDENGNPLSTVYKAAAEAALDQIKSGAYLQELQPTIDLMREQWAEQLKKVYGEDVTRQVGGLVNMTNIFRQILGRGTPFEDAIEQALREGEYFGTGGEPAAKVIEEKLWGAFAAADPKGIVRKAAELFGFSVTDLLTPENVSELSTAIERAAGGDKTKTEEVLNALGISGATVTEVLKDDVTQGIEELRAEPELAQPVVTPPMNNTSMLNSLDEIAQKAKSVMIEANTFLANIGLGFTAAFGAGGFTGSFGGHGFASGGFVRSGDLVTVNENGNFEMMGRMGNQPVVANNQQIVDGITQGVSNANGSVVGEMRTMVGLMQRMLNKEFTARAVPSSGWGRNNSKSADAYERVTG